MINFRKFEFRDFLCFADKNEVAGHEAAEMYAEKQPSRHLFNYYGKFLHLLLCKDSHLV